MPHAHARDTRNRQCSVGKVLGMSEGRAICIAMRNGLRMVCDMDPKATPASFADQANALDELAFRHAEVLDGLGIRQQIHAVCSFVRQLEYGNVVCVGRRGGRAGHGPAKARSTAKARKAANARWGK